MRRRTKKLMSFDINRLRTALDAARNDLFAERELAGSWTGELASSALATATAVSALSLVRRKASASSCQCLGHLDEELGLLIVKGLDWLADAQNPDGGWGDTQRSLSNVATTMLVVAAFRLTGVPAGHGKLIERAEDYIDSQGGVEGLKRRYGKDKTFAVPILTNCALADMIPWREVPSLPFEFACLPQSWFRFLRLPVVSYAIPALVAIGQAKFHHHPPRNPFAWLARTAAVRKSLQVIEGMLPESGGFLEATPLTSFVVMSLASIGRLDHPIVLKSVKFLIRSARADGAWPIDTNLATWNTSLSIAALAESDAPVESDRAPLFRESLLEWLLACQHREPHAYTGAKPGGWAWTDLSGGVPDVDDTSGALLALAAWPTTEDTAPRIRDAASAGVTWLLDVQNSDGGWPTFCRGWGTMPFDRSATDLTAHAVRALRAWRDRLPNRPDHRRTIARIDAAIRSGFAFLARTQLPDGSWLPLWFGNQFHESEANPVYGTAKVLFAYRDFDRMADPAAARALHWLALNQNRDGGWGGGPDLDAVYAVLDREPPSPSPLAPEADDSIEQQRSLNRLPVRSSVEETSLAVEALIAAVSPLAQAELPQHVSIPPWATETSALLRGLTWIQNAIDTRRHREPSPIGFYFAKLWYFEKLYPIIYLVSALSKAVRCPGLAPVAPPAAAYPVNAPTR